MEKTYIRLGKWSQESLDRIIRESSKIKTVGNRIDFLSAQLCGLNYKASTLIGDINTIEILVINLEGVDCFTYLDYVEAMRLASSYSEFVENLRRVRYKKGKVTFINRNHFFTDWIYNNPDIVDDVTDKVAGKAAKHITKMLNRKDDGALFVPGLKPVKRKISYIPSPDIKSSVISRLKTGDYAGIYSNIKGLGVSHVGIIIKNENQVLLRHASSSKENRKVLEQDFMGYISKKSGLIVLRPK